MPNWKKVIVSGSEASLLNLIVDNNVTASFFTGSFKGDGSQLTNLNVDDGLPDNNWDFNIPDYTPINDFQTASTDYLIDFRNEVLVGDPAGLIAWFGNAEGDTQLLPTNNGLIIIADDEQQGLVTSAGYSGSIVGIGNVMNYSQSVDDKWKQTATTGSNTFIGNQTITGSVYVANGGEFYLEGNKLFNYGAFYDTTTQSGSANTAYSMKFNTTDLAHGVSIQNSSRITVANTGIYNLQFSAQLTNTANSSIDFDIWLAYTGSNYSNSNTQLSLVKQSGQLGRLVAAWNWVLPIIQNDYVEIKWSCSDGTGQIYATGSQLNPNRPAIPSVIATLTQIA